MIMLKWVLLCQDSDTYDVKRLSQFKSEGFQIRIRRLRFYLFWSIRWQIWYYVGFSKCQVKTFSRYKTKCCGIKRNIGDLDSEICLSKSKPVNSKHENFVREKIKESWALRGRKQLLIFKQYTKNKILNRENTKRSGINYIGNHAFKFLKIKFSLTGVV